MDSNAPKPGGRQRGLPAWESHVERQIREAMEAGAFDDLPYRGERLPDDGLDGAGEWAMAHRMLRSAGVAPPWIEADKEARRLLAEIETALERWPRASLVARRRERARLRDLVAEANRVIARLNAEAPTPRQHRRPVDVEALLAKLEDGAGSG